jgi:hypothetical protein
MVKVDYDEKRKDAVISKFSVQAQKIFLFDTHRCQTKKEKKSKILPVLWLVKFNMTQS